MSNTEQVFFALLRSGLWELEIELLPYGPVDFDAIYKLAEEQSVIGLVGAALEHITDGKPGKMQIRPFLTWVIAQEQRNSAMNEFIGWLWKRLHEEQIDSVLIKGQGIAQCYSRPNWRAAGDVDLLLDASNYERAKGVLCPLASSVEVEGIAAKHQGMTLGGFEVELHGTFRFGLSHRVDKVMSEIQDQVCSLEANRVWENEGTGINLPSADNDILIIFTHFLRHFYKGGIGLRQICDWCRLLWTYRDTIDRSLLESRLRSCGLLSEWRAFAAFAVDTLGMPPDALPLYSSDRCWSRKGEILRLFILKVGNFGHSRDNSYFSKYPYVIRKSISAFQRLGDGLSHARIFPLDSVRFTFNAILHGAQNAARGE